MSGAAWKMPSPTPPKSVKVKPRATNSAGRSIKEDTNMRAIMIAMLAAAAIGFFSPSGISAAPANGAVIGEAAAAGQMIEKMRRYRRSPPRRRVPYYTYGPYERAEPYGGETLHQLSQENQEQAQRYIGN